MLQSSLLTIDLECGCQQIENHVATIGNKCMDVLSTRKSAYYTFIMYRKRQVTTMIPKIEPKASVLVKG